MSKYKDAMLSVTLVREGGETHELNTAGTLFEVMHVCQTFGLIPDGEPGDSGVIFVHSDSGSFGSLRPIERARDILDHFMEQMHGLHDHDDDLF